MFTSETVNLNVMWIKLSYPLIIELNPSVVTLLYIAEIMTKLCTTVMQYNTLESKLIITWVSLSFLFISCIVVNIQISREL